MKETIGKYRIERELGRGAMGVVYAAVDPGIERRVAVKTIRLDLLDSSERDEVLQRFRREAQAAGRLNHPNIVAVYEYGEDDGQAFIAMELVDGLELKGMLDANQRFDAAGVDRLMAQLLDALDVSHRNGVVHRDIKPANIFVLADGRIKISDFGVARIASSTLTQTGSVLGTPSYMSPEQFMGLAVDGRSDLFSAGVLLYQLLTGEKPFTGSAVTTIMHKVLNEVPPSPSALNFQLPRALDAVVSRALAKRPEDRFQSGREFADALHAAFASTPVADLSEATMLHVAADDQTIARAPVAPPPRPLTPPQAPAPAPAAVAPAPAPKAIAPAAPKASAGLIVGGVVALGVLAAVALFVMRGSGDKAAAPPPPAASAPAPAAASAAPPAAAVPRGNVLQVSAQAVFDPGEERGKLDPAVVRAALNEESKRQMVEKALSFLVADDSLNRHYRLLQDRLIGRGDEFVPEMTAQEQPWLGKDGLMHMRTQGVVRLREVQKSLNQMTRDERVDVIRKKGDPKIAVAITIADAERAAGTPPQRSAVAENTLKERLAQFGYRVWSDATDKPGADFSIVGEAKFKKLSHKLEASGLVISKHVVTSWTIKCVDLATGEEIYYNTQLPEGQSWADEDRAIIALGGLIGDQFSQAFFAQHVRPQPVKLGLSFDGVGDEKLRAALLRELNGLRQVASATLEGKSYALSLSPSEGPSAAHLSATVVEALNRKLGESCFAPGTASGSEASVRLAAGCAEAKVLDLLETRPPAAIYMAPGERRDAIIKNRELRARIST